jgi:hypothetical protein
MNHLGSHRLRIPGRVAFDTLVQVLVFGCDSHRAADAMRSATTLCRRRGDWIPAGPMEMLLDLVLGAPDRMIDLVLDGSAGHCVVPYEQLGQPQQAASQ